MLVMLLPSCADPAPLEGRWVGAVTTSTEAPELVDSTVELRVTTTVDGRRVAELAIGATTYPYIGAEGASSLESATGILSIAAEGDALEASVNAGVNFPVKFHATYFGELPSQDESGDDGDWWVEARVGTSDCVTVDPSAADATTTTGIGELTSAGATATWSMRSSSVMQAGMLNNSVFEADTSLSYSWPGLGFCAAAELDVDFGAGTGTQLCSDGADPATCSGFNLDVSRLNASLGAW